ncbi:MAG TPA: ABC transporter ATP-binding protein [Polyangiaceae bacterium]|nr:ABC transporter ATP-binding protein [Polyangiaceae bacterium]
METILEASHVHKGFGHGPSRSHVLEDVNLKVQKGDFVAIVGFSGSGKSTLVNLLTGLLQPDQGEITFAGKVNPAPGPDRGIVFQNYSLLPWLSVYENVRLGVDQVFPRESESARDERVRKYVAMVSLTPALAKKPGELSGGMRQRVSLARTLAMSPSILLLDEPLGALDALTRAVLQDEIARIRETEETTVVLITNDVDEGILLADRIIPLTPGPRATLGTEFPVDLPRPRDRTAVNHDPAFKALRNEIVSYLTMVRERARRSAKQAPRTAPPVLKPADLRY